MLQTYTVKGYIKSTQLSEYLTAIGRVHYANFCLSERPVRCITCTKKDQT